MEEVKKKRAPARGCCWCSERRKDENGRNYCPHIQCPLEKEDIEWWKKVGGKSLIQEG